MPPGVTHDEHLAQIDKEAAKKRGAAAMGFDQDKAVHHFLLTESGGTIQVEVTDTRDRATRDAIGRHLLEISHEFARGVFDKPLATHAEVPPGVPTMQRLNQSITFAFQETDRGARVLIETSNADAIAAIHDFLRYQIREHATGDPLR